MANYKPPRENESSGEFWQRLREMAKTIEQDDASGQGEVHGKLVARR